MLWLYYCVAVAMSAGVSGWVFYRRGRKAGYAGGLKAGSQKVRPIMAPLPPEEQVDKMFGLLLRSYGLYLFIRPMLSEQKLIARFSGTEKGFWFQELRNVLYSQLVLEICKLVSDGDERVPCIRKLRKLLMDTAVLKALEDKFVPERADFSGSQHTQYALLKEAEAAAYRRDFKERHQKLIATCDRLLKDHAVAGFRMMRHKLIAHNEHGLENGRLVTLDVSTLGLKYGDEVRLLELMREAMDGMSTVVRRSSFDWETFFEPETRHVKAFWEIQ